jgi:hypothetical protein
MSRPRLCDVHQPDAAFAALAVEAAQQGRTDEAERLTRLAERFGRLKLKLRPGELQRLSRLRALERRLELMEHRLDPLMAFLETGFAAKLDEAAAASAARGPDAAP